MQHQESDSKLRLLHAAKKLFAKQGFDATSVRQICEEAGANVALVSYHFGGKEQLFRSIYEHYIDAERLAFAKRLEGNHRALLQAFVESLVDYRFQEPDMVSITLREIAAESNRLELVKGYLLPVWSLLKSILLGGRDAGVFRMESVDYTMMNIMGMCLFPPKYTFLAPILDGPLERAHVARMAVRMAFLAVGLDETTR